MWAQGSRLDSEPQVHYLREEMKTDTPRTDAVEFRHCPPQPEAMTKKHQDAYALSRQLERELGLSKAEVERLKGIKQIKVSRRPYDYECGDGCCSEYGETWSVDGVEVAHGPCDDNRLQQLLKHLGYDARIVNENEDGEEVCEL